MTPGSAAVSVALEPAALPPRGSDVPAITLAGVSFWYRSAAVEALREVSLEVAERELLGIIGASGAGKSTLALVMSGQIPAFVEGRLEGEVLIRGRSIRGVRSADLASIVGIVYQDPESQLYGLTVEEELVVGLENRNVAPDEIRERVAWALDVVGLPPSILERSPYALSGGEKQRVVIAGVLALRPSILVLDEPTSALDPRGKTELYELLARLCREGVTIVIVEHDLERLVRHADRIVLMHEGRVRAVGSPRAVVATQQALESVTIRVPQVSRLAARLDLPGPVPLTVEEAEDQLRDNPAIRRPPVVRAGGPGSESHGAALNARALGTRPSSGVDRSRRCVVELDGVHHRYDDGTEALRGVSLQIDSGEFVALLGPNGSGKTTLARHLNGLLRPTSGRVLVDGRDTRAHTTAELARSVGYLSQNPNHQLIERTVEAEIAVAPRALGLPPGEVRRRVDEAIELLGLEPYRSEHPLLTTLDVKQRVAIASLVALDPAILVLDEPTTALDAAERTRVLELAKRLHERGRGIVLLTHEMDLVAEYCSRAIVLSGGQVRFDGPPVELFGDRDALADASLEPPQVAVLASRLGVSPPWLNVDQAADALQSSGGR